MADIFLSYASEDLYRAKLVAEALESQGWSIWWDRDIAPGKTWAGVIEGALDDARCVVVLWSRASLESHWVRNEARRGHKKQALVPALLDEVDLPLEFEHLQAAPLVEWQGERRHEGFLKLVSALTERLGGASAVDPATVPTATEGRLADTGRPLPTELRDPPLENQLTADLNALRLLDEIPSPEHSTIHKCVLEDEMFVLKGTEAHLCDVEALVQLAGQAPSFSMMATPLAVWAGPDHVWELLHYHDGVSLAEVVEHNRQPIVGDMLRWVTDSICDVLEELQRRHLIHRDINPGNVLITPSHELRLIDWSSTCRASASSSLEAFGTPGYLAPEQEAGSAEYASDWYSLGATCFALANGFPPDKRRPDALTHGIDAISLGRDTFRGYDVDEFFRDLLDPVPAARPVPWGSQFRLRRTSQPIVADWRLLGILDMQRSGHALMFEDNYFMLPMPLDQMRVFQRDMTHHKRAIGSSSYAQINKLLKLYAGDA